MPELPEVETIVRDLDRCWRGRRLRTWTAYDPRVLQRLDLPLDRFNGEKLDEVRRRGKYLVYAFGVGVIIQHLRMTGTMLPIDSPALPGRVRSALGRNLQARCRIEFAGAPPYIFFDTRRFGTIATVREPEAYFRTRRLAPEPLGSDGGDAARDHYRRRLAQTKRTIKATLIDQNVLAGVGNIYADEALHLARIHPGVRSDRLTGEATHRLFDAMVHVMEEAIAKRGTSMSDYLDVNGNPGVFRKYLRVYRREGLACTSCDEGTVVRGRVSGRSSYFCPVCQPDASAG